MDGWMDGELKVHAAEIIFFIHFTAIDTEFTGLSTNDTQKSRCVQLYNEIFKMHSTRY